MAKIRVWRLRDAVTGEQASPRWHFTEALCEPEARKMLKDAVVAVAVPEWIDGWRVA